jgi:hypothetical protein
VRYEVHLDGEERIVLRDGLEEARYGDARRALDHAQRGLADEGYDEWSFGLGYRRDTD